MKRLLLLTLVIILLISATAYAANLSPTKVRQGLPFPDFTVELEDGTVFNLREALSTHKAVMINLWATWCGPCRMEFPYMNIAYDAFGDEIAVVCLSAWDTNPVVSAFKKQSRLSLPMGYDNCGITDAVVRYGIPTSIIVDREGLYSFYECGMITDPGVFMNLWAFYCADDYVSGVYEEVPQCYTIRVQDEAGNPIGGAMLNVCTDTACQIMTTANGKASFNVELPAEYSIHVLKVPEGYTVDTSKEYRMTRGGVLTITLSK